MQPRNFYPSDTARLYEEYTHSGVRYRRVATALVDVVGSLNGLTVVDLGCGTGLLTRMLAERVGSIGRVIAIDASPDMLSIAKKNSDSNVEFICASAETIDNVLNQTIDAVFSSAAFWQFPREPTLRSIAKVLRPGGKLYFNLSAGFFNLKASGMHGVEDRRRPFKQSEVLAKWVQQAHSRYSDKTFPHKDLSRKTESQGLVELEHQLNQFGFELLEAEPLRFEIPRADEYQWLKIPQWTDRSLAPLTYNERLEILDEIFSDIPEDASFLGRWVTITAQLK